MYKSKKSFLLALCLMAGNAFANEVFPVGEDSFYYEIGGGSNIPYLSSSEKHRIPLNASADLRIGSVCSQFDPDVSLKNSLNNMTSISKGLGGSLIDTAKGALLNVGPYIFAKANPTLYNLFHNAFIGAKENFTLSNKKCLDMERDIQAGRDPFEGIIKVSNQHGWKKEMSIGGDLNQAKETVEQKAAEEGVVWVNNTYKGGRGQEALNIIGDTVEAGYDIMSKQNMFSTGERNAFNIFSDAKDAKKWIVNVVGEYHLVTYKTQKANIEPGFGLMPYLNAKAVEIQILLQAMVEQTQSASFDNIRKISAPGVIINDAVVQNIRVRPKYQQQLIINRLSEEAATSISIEKAWQAKKILQIGSQDPYITQVEVAGRQIQKSIDRIDTEIREIMDALEIKKSLVSGTVNAMFAEQRQKAKNVMFLARDLGDELAFEGAHSLGRDN